MTATRRRRPTFALANDALIREAATSLLAREGLATFSLFNVARAAGLSQSVMGRFDNRDALLCDVWKNVASERLHQLVQWAHSELNQSDSSESTPDRIELKSLIRPTDVSLAFTELVVLSATIPTLREVVRATFSEHLQKLADSNPVRATQVVFLLQIAIGTMIEQRVARINVAEVLNVIAEMVDAIRNPADVVTLPAVDALHLRQYPFNTGDEVRDRILTSCLLNVGTRGYENTTTKGIAKDAEVSEGMLFSMFATKIDVFFEASAVQMQLGFASNIDFIRDIHTKYGGGIANAILIREWQSPELATKRAALLEQTRMTWHNSQLRKRIEKTKKELIAASDLLASNTDVSEHSQALQFVEVAIPSGVYVIADLFPPAEKLPYCVVTLKALAN